MHLFTETISFTFSDKPNNKSSIEFNSLLVLLRTKVHLPKILTLGTRCEIEVNPCDLINCQNGAGCVVNSDQIAVCECLLGFEGQYIMIIQFNILS